MSFGLLSKETDSKSSALKSEPKPIVVALNEKSLGNFNSIEASGIRYSCILKNYPKFSIGRKIIHTMNIVPRIPTEKKDFYYGLNIYFWERMYSTALFSN